MEHPAPDHPPAGRLYLLALIVLLAAGWLLSACWEARQTLVRTPPVRWHH